MSLEAYTRAYRHALLTLDAVHPTRLGLALNFAVFYHGEHCLRKVIKDSGC
jgi:14-3-3 protein epsilon